MSVKYHIKDDGMPGKCSASSLDKCPKTQSGDPFHGDLAEATKEAERRFEEKLGSFVTASKEELEKTEKAEKFVDSYQKASSAVVDDPSNPQAAATLRDLQNDLENKLRIGQANEILDNETYKEAEKALSKVGVSRRSNKVVADGGEIYLHPQGKIIRVDADGNVRAYKGDREVGTSATAEKLRAGYGAWKKVEVSSDNESSRAQKLNDCKEKFDEALEDLKSAKANLDGIDKKIREYDIEFGESEGRAYHYVRQNGSLVRVEGKYPHLYGGRTYYKDIPSKVQERMDALGEWKRAVDRKEAIQAELESAGGGHFIPDDGNTIRVRNYAQKHLLQDELLGQISDGKWENTANNPWQDWANATVIVDPQNAGRNFFTPKDNYQLNAADLLEAVGDRMEENVRDKTGNTNYSSKDMYEDLKDLRRIFKTKRPVLGD